MKYLEKKLDENYTSMLQAVLNKCWKQHSTKQQLMVAYLPSHKSSKKEEQDIVGEIETNS